MPRSPEDSEDVAAAPQKGLPIRPLLRIVQRKFWLILGVAVVFAVPAYQSGKKMLPTYAGGFRLLVEPATTEARITDPTVLTRTSGGVPNRDLLMLDYPTQVEILQSPAVLSEVHEQVQARYPDFSYEDLAGGLLVKRTGTNLTDATKVLAVTYNGGTDPEQVQFILDKLAERYLKYSLEERRTRISEGVRFIEEQLPAVESRVGELQGQIQTLQQQNNLLDPTIQGQQLFTQIQQITNQQLDTQRQLQEQQTLYATLQQQLQMSPDTAIAASVLSEDPRYQQLLNQLKDIERQIATESTRFNDASPVIQRLRDRQDNLAALLAQASQETLGPMLTDATVDPQVLAFQNSVRMNLIRQLVDTTNQIRVLEVRNATLAQTVNRYQQQAEAFPAIARRYIELQRQLDIAARTLEQLLTQRETLRVQSAQTQVPWELVAKPEIPKDAAGQPVATAPDSTKPLMMGVVMGLGIGFVAAFLLEKWRNIFYSCADVQDAVAAPWLGPIPLTATAPTESESSPFLEAFNSLYASLRFLPREDPIRSIVVASAMAGDGKTAIALQLAQTAAAMGQRVLLVDANLRSPQIHQRLGLPNLKGLGDLLVNDREGLEGLQQGESLGNLQVLTAGQLSPEAVNLLASSQMETLMSKFQALFDLVIYDSPALNQAVDAHFLAPQTDGLLLVVKLQQTRCSEFSQTWTHIETYGSPVLGAIANGVGTRISIWDFV